MSQTVQTQFGTGTIVDTESIRGRVSYKVEGPGFSTWIEASAMPLDFQLMPGPEDIQDNSTILPYNPTPQSWTNPHEQNIQPGQSINPRKRTAPADSVDFQEESENYTPGPDPRLFATGGLDPQDIQAKLGSKYVNAFDEHDYISLQARIEENPDLVMAEYRERVAELVAAADQEYLERVGRNEYLESSDSQIREAAWKDVRAKAVRLRQSGQVNLQAASPDIIATQVTGDHGTYEVLVVRSNIFQGNSSVDSWSCECPWGQWAFKRERKFVGRLCSHAYASLMELQALMKSKTNNPKFRNHPGIMSFREAAQGSIEELVEMAADNYESDTGNDPMTSPDFITQYLLNWAGAHARDVDMEEFTQAAEMEGYGWSSYGSRQAKIEVGDSIYHQDYADIYGEVVEDSGDAYLVDGTAGEAWIDHEDARLASRTAEIVDLRPVGWDPYSRNLMNKLRTLWEEGRRPGHEKERNEEVRELVEELRDRGFATDGIVASLKEAKPIGDPKFEVGDEVTQIDANESASGSGTIDDMYQEHGGWFYDVIWDDGSVSSTGQAALRHGFIDRPLGYGDLPDYGTSQDYILEHELENREDVMEPEFVYPAGGDHGVVNDLNDGGGGRSARLVTASGWSFDSNNGSLRFDDGTVRVSIGAGSNFSNSDHLAEGQWGAFVQSGASNQMVGNGRAGTVEDAYAAASAAVQSEGASLPPIDVDYHRISAYEDDYAYGEPPAYDSGDEFGGDEDPFYVDPMEREDFPEDDIVASFQRNAGHLLGGSEGVVSGGHDDIAAYAEAHLRTAGRNFTMAEQQALIDEDDGNPYDRSGLRLRGTHYEGGI